MSKREAPPTNTISLTHIWRQQLTRKSNSHEKFSTLLLDLRLKRRVNQYSCRPLMLLIAVFYFRECLTNNSNAFVM